MKYLSAGNGSVRVEVTAEECDLIAGGVADGSVGSLYEGEDLSVSGQLSVNFRALERVARMTEGG